MIFSQFTKRSISDQTGVFGYEFDVSLDNLYGRCEVGFSGDAVFAFVLESGRIYDANSHFVGSYQPNVPVSISGQIGTHSYDYFINDNPIGIGLQRSGAKYSWWYVNPVNVNADATINVYGELPTYAVDPSGIYQGSGIPIIGNIVNLNPEVGFRIFSGELNSNDGIYELASYPTGYISGSGQFVITSNDAFTADTVLPLTFYTNFGQIDINYLVQGYKARFNSIYMSMTPDDTTVLNGRRKLYNVYLSNYPDTAQVSVSLSYLSGITGEILEAVSTTNMAYENLSGEMTGCGVLVTYYQGEVTGIDPVTMLPVTGSGSGFLYSDLLCPTGTVTQNFVVQAIGYGDGYFKGNFFVSGQIEGLGSGDVGILGGYSSPRVFTDVPGHGDTPFSADGTVPSATGQAYLHPTGYFHVSFPLSYESGQYVSGDISVVKTYNGWLYQDYTVLAVGYATGKYEQGQTSPDFNINFDPGYYIFTKQFSGTVTGKGVTIATFDPSICEQKDELNSGILTGLFSWPPNMVYATESDFGGYLSCADGKLPTIAFSGIPPVIYASDGNIYPNHQVVLVVPDGGFSANETSDQALLGYYTRTMTSRMGATPSGTGFFNQIVQECLYPSGVWRETMESYGMQVLNDPLSTHLRKFSSSIYLHETGVLESGYLQFHISGDSVKQVVFLGLDETANSTNPYVGFLDPYTSGTDNIKQSPILSLYAHLTGWSDATGYLDFLSPPFGSQIRINNVLLTYQTGEYVTGEAGLYVFYDSYTLCSLLNSLSVPTDVYGSISGDANRVYLQSRIFGTSGNFIPLSGDSFFAFSGPFLSGGIDEGTIRDALLIRNQGWINSDFTTQNLLYSYQIAPTRSTDSAISATLPAGDYTAVIEYNPVSSSTQMRGFVEFEYPVYSGCENWPNIPVTLTRVSGSYGIISGSITFVSSYPYNDGPISGLDYTDASGPFTFYDGQTSLTVPLPLIDNPFWEDTRKLNAFITAYYDGPDSMLALGDQTTAQVLIYDDDQPSGCPIVGAPVPFTLSGNCFLELIGDTHAIFWNTLMTDYKQSPFNIDDNIRANKVLWFAAEDANGVVWKVEYEQGETPWLAGGFAVNKVIVTKDVGADTIDAQTGQTVYYTTGLGGFLDMITFSQGNNDCYVENPDFPYLQINSAPTIQWTTLKRIGGLFYYLLKAATIAGSGKNNNHTDTTYDGFSAFLGKYSQGVRSKFEQYSSIEDVTEVMSLSMVTNILNKWNELAGITGACDASWDSLMQACAGGGIIGLGGTSQGGGPSGPPSGPPYNPPSGGAGGGGNGGPGNNEPPEQRCPAGYTLQDKKCVKTPQDLTPQVSCWFRDDCFETNDQTTSTMEVTVSMPAGPPGLYLINVVVQGITQGGTIAPGGTNSFEFTGVKVIPGSKSSISATASVSVNGNVHTGTGGSIPPPLCKGCFSKGSSQTSVTVGRQDVCRENCTTKECEGVATSFDLSRWTPAGVMGKGKNRLWKLVERAFNLTYATDIVSSDGTLVNLPSSFAGNECYPGDMVLIVYCDPATT